MPSQFLFDPADENTLAYFDGFGLTRWCLPKKAKTQSKYQRGIRGHLSLMENQLHAYCDWSGPSATSSKAHAFAWPALKPEGRGMRAFGEPGTPIVRDAVEGVEIVAGTQAFHQAPATTKTLEMGDGAVERFADPVLYVRVREGAFSRIEGTHVWWARLAESGAVDTRYCVAVDTAGGTFFDVWPRKDSCVMVCWSVRTSTASVVTVTDGGEARECITSLAPPVATAGRLAWQPDEQTVVVREADGTCASYDLTETRRGDRPSHLQGVSDVGRGTVLLGRTRSCFVPFHGETIVDLGAGVQVDRKLSKPLATLRHQLARNIEDGRKEWASEGVFAEVAAFWKAKYVYGTVGTYGASSAGTKVNKQARRNLPGSDVIQITGASSSPWD